MTAAWVPPRATYHVRVFAVCLVLVVIGLAGLLFGVELEAVVPATGVITAHDVRDARVLVAGLVEPGWYEGDVGGHRVRMDAHGNGRLDPAAGSTGPVIAGEWHRNGEKVPVRNRAFHRLEPGDELWPGQALASVRTDELRFRLQTVEEQIKEGESRGPNGGLVREREHLRDLLAQSVLHAPESDDRWLALDVRVSPLQAVSPGDVVATLVPIDPKTGQPRDLMARLDVKEEHWGALSQDQKVRLHSAVHNHRLHGDAEARIERLEPGCHSAGNGERRFHALAPVTASPFALPIGSSFKAEVVVGRKVVYRIILEH